MTKLITHFLGAIMLLIFPFMGLAQVSDSISLPTSPKANRSAYIGISVGIGLSNFRDFATSPLIYHGAPKYMAGSFIRENSLRETEIRLSSIFGNFAVAVGDEASVSKSTFINIYYSRLFGLKKLNNEKWNFKAGGLYKLSGDLRQNASLGNNAIGIDFFSTIFASAKVSKDVSRKSAKNKKFLFIKYKVKPRKRNIAFRLNIGVINTTIRNGYSYSGQSGILNEQGLLDGYEPKMFSGFRMNTQFDYTIYMKNKNAIQLSYIWDAAKTGGDLDKFEVAHHTFKVTLLFNTNNK